MRIAAITDIHGHLGRLQALRSELEGVSALIVAGDITHFGGKKEADAVCSALETLAPRILAVTGNCDPPEVREALTSRGACIEKKLVLFEGVSFFGLGGSLPCPGRTPNEYSEKEYGTILKGAEGARRPLVLVSHQPPYDTRIDMLATGRHVGSMSVRAFIEEQRPLLCISGHIHEAFGTDEVAGCKLINPGPFQFGGIACFEINGESVEVELKKVRDH